MPACRSSVVCLFLLASAALAIGGAHAQPSSATQPPQQYKFSTRIAPGVAIPDSVETRLGTLKFFDGFPDDATVEKLYDNLDFQRAVQAYLLGLAPVNQLANRKGILEVGPANTTVPIFETMMNARSIFLTPNNNTPYTWFWLDLRNGPLVARGSAEGPRTARRHVVSLCHRHRHGGAGQGQGRQVPDPSARVQGRSPGGLLRGAIGDVQHLDRVAHLPGERRPEAGRGSGQEVHEDLPAVAGRPIRRS